MLALPFVGTILGFVRGLIANPKAILDFLKSPPGILLCAAVLFLAGDLWGRHKANAKWQARFEQSVHDAKETDREADNEALRRMSQQAKANQDRADATEERIKSYAQDVSQRLGACDLLDEKDADFLNSIGLPVPARPASAAAPPPPPAVAPVPPRRLHIRRRPAQPPAARPRDVRPPAQAGGSAGR
jgi:hypothetical protein